MVYYLRLMIACFCLLLQLNVAAQRTPPPTPPLCGTPDLTDEQRQSLTNQAMLALRKKQASNAAFTGIMYVPIRPHIYRRSDGTGGMTLAKMNNVVALVNSYYLLNGTGIQFYFCGTSPDYIDNDDLYNSFPTYDETSANGRDAVNALNQYYVNEFDQNGLGGYSYFPSNSLQSTRSFILNEDDELDLGNRLLPHELGHNFNLYHTFGNTSGGTNELVTRGSGANCATAGDALCDTPADPYGMSGATTLFVNGCQTYNGTATDAQGNLFTPSMTNMMSYYFACTHDFTPGQYDRMQAGLALRQTHTAYSLDCPATVAASPTNVVATINNGNVLISWQDNATNEMGYFIERSTAPTSGFLPVGGVAPNTNSYTDLKIAALTTYYYRIRPSNATTQGVSQTTSVSTPACHPVYSSYACTDGDGLNGLVINSSTLSQNSGCSPGGYSSTSAVSATVLAGQKALFTGALFATNYPEGVTIWADLNRNGVFEAGKNELLYQSPGTITGQFSGSLTFPSSLSGGQMAIRVIVSYNMIPTDPCGAYSYGETEDYQIMVQPVSSPILTADIRLSMQVNKRITISNQPVSYSLTVLNNGPNKATGISWQNRLPANMSFVSGDAGIVNSTTAVSSSSLSLNIGESVTYVYQLQPTQPGTYLNSAQILTSDQLDPDSRPGSGTGDGEDDAATVDIQVPDSSTATTRSVFVSPNPNQIALPSVSSNQPAPVPNKADLSMAMMVSSRVPVIGQSVTFTLIVSNSGSLSATSIVIRDTLRGLALTASSNSMSVVGAGNGYTIIEGNIAALDSGGVVPLIFTVVTITSGHIVNAAQVWSVATLDSDSKSGSVTPTANNLNGEDDVACVDLRVESTDLK